MFFCLLKCSSVLQDSTYTISQRTNMMKVIIEIAKVSYPHAVMYLIASQNTFSTEKNKYLCGAVPSKIQSAT